MAVFVSRNESSDRLLADIPPTTRKQLVALDFETQPARFRQRNSFLRIFDKYLWIEEKRRA